MINISDVKSDEKSPFFLTRNDRFLFWLYSIKREVSAANLNLLGNLMSDKFSFLKKEIIILKWKEIICPMILKQKMK